MSSTEALIKQLSKLAIENKPESCLGCGFEHNCSTHGCVAIKTAISKINSLQRLQKPCST